MTNNITIKQLKDVDVQDGYLIDGFPSVGLASAIATESMIHYMNFETVGIIDSKYFAPVSVITKGIPNHPAKIHVNKELKMAVFSSYLSPDSYIHKDLAHSMLKWAKEHNCSTIVSSARIKSEEQEAVVTGVGSTESARKKISDAGITPLQNGTVPGIPGVLLNEGALEGRDVIVILITSKQQGPDFRASAQLCMAMSKLIPGIACDIDNLLKEAQSVEHDIKETDESVKPMRDRMYG